MAIQGPPRGRADAPPMPSMPPARRSRTFRMLKSCGACMGARRSGGPGACGACARGAKGGPGSRVNPACGRKRGGACQRAAGGPARGDGCGLLSGSSSLGCPSLWAEARPTCGAARVVGYRPRPCACAGSGRAEAMLRAAALGRRLHVAARERA
eukprot:355105-Chlamydomonas_euryale.AAC.2